MTPLHWSIRFETGNETVDLQHRYFVDLVNRLAVELQASDDRAYRARILQELHAYARFHFLSEENVLSRVAPAALESHRALHEQLLCDLGNHLQKTTDRPDEVDDVMGFVGKWLIEHTLNEDRRAFGK
jgi:hemerythrin